MFLNKDDLYLTILEDELAEITRNDDTLVEAALSGATSEMKTLLNDSFDTASIFNATGIDRHPLLVRLGADIAVYYIVARCQAGQELDDRTRRYDRAITTLKSFRDSDTFADLPRREKTAQTNVVYNSNPKRGNYY